MNYSNLLKSLLNEARSGIQFKRLNNVCKVLAIIGLIPLIISTFISVCVYAVMNFIYKGVIAPINYLHDLVKKEGNEVKHGTQVVVYVISFPLIFFSHVCYSLFSLGFYFMWFVLMINVYLLTLCGVKWQPIISEATFEERKWEVKPSNALANTWVIVLIISYCLIVLSMFIPLIYGLIIDFAFFFDYAPDIIVLLSPTVFVWVVMVMLLIVNPLLFRKKEIKTDK